MANDHAFGAVPATDLLAGRVLRSASIEAMGGAFNWLLAEGRSKLKIWHKGLPDAFAAGIAAHTGASTEMLAAALRIPTISSAHEDLHFRVRVTVVGAGNADITFTAASGDTTTVSSGAAGPVDLEDVVTVDTTADYDDITIQLETDVGTDLVVHSVELWHEPIADPIPAATAFDDAQAFGITSLGPDYPHDAGLNEAFVDAVEHLCDCRRVLWVDAAIATAVGGDGVLLDRVYQTWATRAFGSARREVPLRAWFNAERPAPPADAYIYLLVGSPQDWPNAHHPKTVTADGWQEIASVLLATEAAPYEQLPVPSTCLGIWPAPTGEVPQGRTTALIYSLSVWEEP